MQYQGNMLETGIICSNVHATYVIVIEVLSLCCILIGHKKKMALRHS